MVYDQVSNGNAFLMLEYLLQLSMLGSIPDVLKHSPKAQLVNEQVTSCKRLVIEPFRPRMRNGLWHLMLKRFIRREINFASNGK